MGYNKKFFFPGQFSLALPTVNPRDFNFTVWGASRVQTPAYVNGLVPLFYCTMVTAYFIFDIEAKTEFNFITFRDQSRNHRVVSRAVSASSTLRMRLQISPDGATVVNPPISQTLMPTMARRINNGRPS